MRASVPAQRHANRVRPTRPALALAGLGAIAALAPALAPSVTLPLALAPLPLIALGAGMLVDLLLSPRPWNVSAKASVAPETFVGTRTVLRVAARGLASGEAELASLDGVRMAGTPGAPPGADARADASDGADALTAPLRDGLASFDLACSRRARHRPGPIHLVWRGRLGLLEFAAIRPLDAPFAVVSDLRPVLSGAIELEMRSVLFGAKRTAFRGDGSQFHQLSDYVAGMDPRTIDWKRSAPARRLLAKEMRAERNHHVVIALAHGRLMREEVGGLSKLDHGLNTALALAWAALRHGDEVGFMGFDHRPRLWLPPRGGMATFARLRTRTADLTPGEREANHVLALTRLFRSLKRRSLLVVVSDFGEPLSAELIGEHLAALRRRHVVVFATLADPWLRALVEAEARSMEEVARAVAAETWLAERAGMLARMEAAGVRVIEAAPGALTPALLSAYLDIVLREAV